MSEPAQQPEPEPEPVFSADDLAQAREDGRAEGRAAAAGEAASSLDQQIAATLERLAGAISATAGDRDRIVADCERRAGHLAAAIVRRIVPVCAADRGPAAVTEAVAQVLAGLREPQRLTVRVCVAERAAIVDRLADADHTGATAGVIDVIADPSVGAGDCRIDWDGGHAVRDTGALWREVDAILTRSFGAAATEPIVAAAGSDDDPQRTPSASPDGSPVAAVATG